jgi:hypothetical protein
MEGLKVVGTGRPDAPTQCASGYSFAELFAPIQRDAHDLCWALRGSVVFVAAAKGVVSPDDEVLDAMFEVSPGVPPPPHDYQPVWERGWLKPGYLDELAPLVTGDWTDIIGTSFPPAHARSDVYPGDKEWLERNARIYFACVDAAFWEIYAQDTGILRKLAALFPRSEPRMLRDKDY